MPRKKKKPRRKSESRKQSIRDNLKIRTQNLESHADDTRAHDTLAIMMAGASLFPEIGVRKDSCSEHLNSELNESGFLQPD